MLRAVMPDPKVVFWTAALVNMGLAVALALAGVRRVRRGEIEAHRRFMLGAAALVGLFLVAYVAKLAFLGREQLGLWDPFYVWTLRFHETCVLTMVIAGARAVLLGAREGFRDPERARVHRRAGRIALVSAGLGVISASVVLYGMYERAGQA
jgi:uncharacterized membrane protein YozB (DUF420 family)